MTRRHSLIAFVSVLVAIVGLALIAAANKQFDSTVFGSAITGLIGIAGTFRPRQTSGDVP